MKLWWCNCYKAIFSKIRQLTVKRFLTQNQKNYYEYNDESFPHPIFVSRFHTWAFCSDEAKVGSENNSGAVSACACSSSSIVTLTWPVLAENEAD